MGGKKRLRLAGAVGACLALQACGPRQDPGGEPGVFEPGPTSRIEPHPWRVALEDPNATAPALLWNGLIGVRIGRTGSGIDGKDVPLPFFMLDEYGTDGEEKVRSLPNPLVQIWEIAGKRLQPQRGTGYGQELDLQTGDVVTGWMEPREGGSIVVSCRTAIDPERRIVSQRWEAKPPNGSQVRYEALIVSPKYTSPSPPKGTVADSEVVYAPSGARARVAILLHGGEGRWTNTGKGWLWEGKATGDSLVVERTVALGRSPNWIAMQAARGIAVKMRAGWDDPPKPPSFAEVRAASEAHWKRAWETDVEIDGPVEDQQAVRSFLYYLRSAIHPEGEMGVAPFGLSNAAYSGHVFWDADIWVFPALALLDPERAKAIPSYRLQRLAAASENVPRLGSREQLDLLGSRVASRFPWESSVSGREVAPQEPRKQIHVSGSVLWGLQQAAALGLADPNAVDRAGRGVAEFYATRARTSSRGGLELHDVMSPDEFHTGNNDLYTNLLAQWTLRTFGGPAHKDATFYLPRDATSLLTYDDDPVRSYKQAAAVLAVYPLQYPEAERQAQEMLKRFGPIVTPNGPAMSDSVHATIWSRLGKPERAYETWKRSWQPYTDHGLMLFSEKPRSERTYFTTGAAGCLQTVLYGFLGFRIDSKKEPGAVWSKALNRGMVLSVKPRLPKEWKRVTLRNFTVLGKRYTLEATHRGARVTPGE